MTDDTLKPETDTAVLRRVAPGFAWIPRELLKRITLPSLWVVLVSIIGVVITGAVRVTHDETKLDQLDKSVTKLESQDKLLQKINTQLQVMDTKVDMITNEVNRQREWRERIEDVAEIPPHPRRKVR